MEDFHTQRTNGAALRGRLLTVLRRPLSKALAILATIVILIWNWRTPPSDRSVGNRFDDARKHYSTLVRMMEEDANVGTIGDGFELATERDYIDSTTQELGITQDRLHEYRRIMDLAGVVRIDRLRDDQGVQLMVWAWGGIDVFHHKGVAWYYDPPVSNDWRRYRHIEGNWYIFED